MKRINNMLAVLVAALVCLSMFNLSTVDKANAATMSFTQTSYSLKGGASQKLYLTGNSPDAVSWSSSNTKAVEINSYNSRSATVYAVGEGTATITATDKDGNKAYCSVTVYVNDIKLSAKTMKVGVENSIKITAICDDYVTWKSSNDDIAQVYSSDGVYDDDYRRIGDEALITGSGLGNATITATSEYGKTATCKITVVDSYIEVEESSVTINLWWDDDYYYHGDSYTCNNKVITGHASYVSSSNDKVATAKRDEYYPNDDIIVEAKGLGTATITVTDDGGAKTSFTVTVKGKFALDKSAVTINKESPYDDYNGVHYIGDYYNDIQTVNSSSTVITKAVSSNTNIVKITKDEYNSYFEMIPVAAGTATITCYDDYGQKASFTVTVVKDFKKDDDYYYDDDDDYDTPKTLKNSSYVNKIKYGQKTVTGKTYSKASVTVTIGKKKYKTKANNSGRFSKKIPVKKIGTKVKVIFKKGKEKCTKSKKIAKPSMKIKTPKYVYRNTKKMKIKLTNVHKGDVITVKVGRKHYKKKFKKDKKKVTYRIKLPSYKTPGSKIKINIQNKFKQSLKSKKKKIYYASKVKVGMTKKQCKLVPGWEYPDDSRVLGDTTMWWYDDDGDGISLDSYLHFYRGRLKSWKVY